MLYCISCEGESNENLKSAKKKSSTYRVQLYRTYLQYTSCEKMFKVFIWLALIYKIEIVCVCSIRARERINLFAPNLVCLFLETRKRIYIGQNSGKVSWVRVPVTAVCVARKLITIEERRQDQSCLFQRADYRNKGHNPANLSWVRVPVRMLLQLLN
jgi:hypothetical protein